MPSHHYNSGSGSGVSWAVAWLALIAVAAAFFAMSGVTPNQVVDGVAHWIRDLSGR